MAVFPELFEIESEGWYADGLTLFLFICVLEINNPEIVKTARINH